MAIGTAILSQLGSVVTGIANIWTSTNQLKSNKLAIQQDEQKVLQLQEQGDIEAEKTLQMAINLKIEQQKVLETKEKTNANIRGIIYFLFFGFLAFILWLLFAPKRRRNETYVQNPYNDSGGMGLGSVKKRHLLNDNR